MKKRILLAEDDANLGSLLRNYLQAKEYETTLFVNGRAALEHFASGMYDLCILDIMMPEMDGLTLAKAFRNIDPVIPVIFLTAKNQEDDIIEGFKTGADDYITKPFSMEELLLRMQAILRRTEESGKNAATENIFPIGNYLFEYNRQTLTIQGKEQKLTSKEAGLLRLLCLHANDVLDRGTALKEVWNDDSYFNARSMDVYIVKLRKYLKEDPRVELINVHGVGFKLVMNK